MTSLILQCPLPLRNLWVLYMSYQCIMEIVIYHICLNLLLTIHLIKLITVHTEHCNDVTMRAMASQITSVSMVYSTVYSQRKYQSSALLAFVSGIHRWLVKSPYKAPVRSQMFPFDDFFIKQAKNLHDLACLISFCHLSTKPCDVQCFTDMQETKLF